MDDARKPQAPLKGRGAASRVAGRYQKAVTTGSDDGWGSVYADAAELRLRNSLKTIRVTATQYYPALSLTGSLGSSATSLGDVLRRSGKKGLTSVQDISRVGRVQTAHAVEEGRFARALGANECDHLALRNLETHAVEGDHATESHHYIADVEQ